MRGYLAWIVTMVAMFSSFAYAFVVPDPEEFKKLYYGVWFQCVDKKGDSYTLEFNARSTQCVIDGVNGRQSGSLTVIKSVPALLCETDDPPLKMWVNTKEGSFRYGVGRSKGYTRLVDSKSKACKMDSDCGPVPCYLQKQ